MTSWMGPPQPNNGPVSFYAPVLGVIRIVLVILLTVVLLGLFLLVRPWVRTRLGNAAARLLSQVWSRGGLAILGVRVEHRGRPEPRGAVVVANHVTWLDILALRTGPFTTYVAKSEVAGWPGVGPLAKLNNTMFVERRRGAAKTQESEMIARLERGEHLVFFPEGTSSDGQRVLPFKSALFAAFSKPPLSETVVVQPTGLSWIAPPDQPHTFFGWWGTMGLTPSIWAIATRAWGGRLIVSWQPVLRPNDFEDRKALALACETSVADALRNAGVPDVLTGQEAWDQLEPT